ncbi:MAG: hypothetical protein ABR499_01695 [Gemmatimonadaceae bacterium]
MRQHIRRVLPLAAAAVVTACVVRAGQRTDHYVLANEPRGVTARLSVEGRGAVSGELLEVQDTAFLLMAGPEVLVVPYHRLQGASFEQTGRYHVGAQGPTPAARNELRLRSRYPQGVSPEVLAKLLALTGQSAPRVIGR